MADRQYYVWEWIDKYGTPKYLKWGPAINGIHPAVRVWDNRTKLPSRLNYWLCRLEKEPTRSLELPHCPLGATDAEELYKGRRADNQLRGIKMLSARSVESFDGGGFARGVVSPEGEVYKSVREAAEDQLVNPGTVTRWCNDITSGWQYLRDTRIADLKRVRNE